MNEMSKQTIRQRLQKVEDVVSKCTRCSVLDTAETTELDRKPQICMHGGMRRGRGTNAEQIQKIHKQAKESEILENIYDFASG